MRYIKRILITIQCFFIKLTSFIFIMFGMVKNKKTQHVNDVIVSFTSFGVRVKKTAWLAAYSMLNQSVHPDKIILYLDNNNWNENNIPFILRKLQKLGIEIRFCEDIKSYKKLVPALQDFPNKNIITIDDDIYYSSNFVKEFVNIYSQNDDCVCALKANEPLILDDGKWAPYNEWKRCSTDKKEVNLFSVGFGGVFYPKNIFSKEQMNPKDFMVICPRADDIWFNCARISLGKKLLFHNTQEVIYYPVNYFYERFHKGSALTDFNVYEGQNNLQLKKSMEKFKINETK